MADALATIEAVFKKVIPSVPFNYDFVDQEYASKFAVEERIGKLAALFAGLTIRNTLQISDIIQAVSRIGLVNEKQERDTPLYGLVFKVFFYFEQVRTPFSV
ncbi:hypothetical protein [Larkinella soli]|uniref:hypothetical protein n=1 Tax=Larkinella soli TaxID=1770527 RepID=UPI000FFB802B|nr:hypothetical protein [Larkinella soli]